MSAVFADTFYWIALTNKRDSAHQAVMKSTARFGPRTVITSDEVLTEFLAFRASDVMLRAAAGGAVKGLLSKPDIRIIPQSRNSFMEGGSSSAQSRRPQILLSRPARPREIVRYDWRRIAGLLICRICRSCNSTIR